MTRKNISSSSPYEEIIGFSRAVRVGNHIVIGGTAPIGEDGQTIGVGDAAAQARRCFEIIAAALEKAGASLSDVVRTRILLVDIADWEEVVKVRAEYLRSFKPVDTIMEVSRFVDPDWRIEIEVDAVVDAP